MIPIQLTIEGLYSYQSRQKIDFENLTEAGLFGIFGTVGSGKSSILEAITFALYGETERMNSKEKRAYNMMNLKSDKSLIEFEFYNHNNDRFKITRSFKRNSKRFEDVKPVDTILYEYKMNQWIPLEHTNAEEIIGLSYTNFKRTIIIPQGQFKEFLELGATDRTRMMKEIFGLQRYDLQDKTVILVKKNQSDLDQLQGKLSGFEEVSEENINQLIIESSNKEKLAADIQERYNTINTQFQQLKVLKEDYEKLQIKKEEFSKAQEQKIKIDEEEQQLKYYEIIVETFQNIFNEDQKVATDIATKSESVKTQEKDLLQIEETLMQITNKLSELQPQYEKLSTKRIEELDLEKIIEILHYQKDIATLKQRTETGKKEVEKVQNEQKELSEKIKSSELEIKSLSEKRIESQTLISVGNWFSKQENLKKSLENIQDKVNIKKAELDQIKNKLNTEKTDLTTYKTDFENVIASLQQEKKKLRAEKSKLELQQNLEHYSDNLNEGEPCPLCGSKEHPNIAQLNDVSVQITMIDQSIENLEIKENKIRDEFSQIQSEIQKIAYIETELEAENKNKTEIELQIKEHLKQFIWSDFDPKKPESFQQKQQESLDLEKQISLKNEEISLQRVSLEKANENVLKYEKALSEFQISEKEKQTQILQNTSNLKVLKFIDYQEKEIKEVENILIELKSNNKKVEEDFLKFKEKQNELAVEQSGKKATITQLNEDLKQLYTISKNLQQQISERLIQLDIPTIEKVKETLDWRLDTISLHEKIKNFQIQFQTLQHIIKDLETKFEKNPFDENVFAQHQEKFGLIAQELKSANDEIAKIKAEIERLTKAFNDKKELLIELEKIQKRAENLKTLSNLFKGAGFVQYVSSIYLSQLCDHANVRFRRMTRGQLSLQLNENNDFEVKDYLNEGKNRSVKTLSGGQAFQVSLSLALALAESVQSNAKSDKNFFFIDEGFGTQDAESINIVFETLQSLQKENRIVGIISHVEELKERIPISLQITKSEESGSIIEVIN